MGRKRRELEAEIVRLQRVVEAMKCKSYIQAHLLNGAVCTRDNGAHEWHKTTVHYSALTAHFEIEVKWKTTEIVEEIDSE